MLREQADLPGLGRSELESEAGEAGHPVVARGLQAGPGPAAIAVEAQVGIRPSARCPAGRARARVRSADEPIAEPLQSGTVAGVEERVVVHHPIITETVRRGPSNGRAGTGRRVRVVRRSFLALVLVAMLAACTDPSGGGGGASSEAPAGGATSAPKGGEPGY